VYHIPDKNGIIRISMIEWVCVGVVGCWLFGMLDLLCYE
jgi:hypothetical protein